MLSRFSDVLQTAADVLAPPATRLEDFEYHWKMILNFYQNYDDNSKIHVEDSRIPHHLHHMLQLIVEEEKEQQGGTVGPCLESIIQRSICVLDVLTALAAADRPPGARALALTTGTALLRRTRHPCLNSAHVYRPLQRMLIQCNENPASPTEKEEVELLLTLCGLVRKEPGLANIFTTPFVEDKSTLLSIPEDIQKLIPIKTKVQTPKKNPLFEVELPPNPLKSVSIVRTNSHDNGSNSSDDASCKSHKTVYEDNDKFLLIDLLLSYLNSADNQVVLRSCEGIMIVSSLPSDDIANLVTSCSPVCEAIVEKLAQKYKCIPANSDPGDVGHLNITRYVVHDFGDKHLNKFHGHREMTSFFSWLDYCDTLMKECHPSIASHLSRIFRQNFLESCAETGLRDLHHAALVAAVLAKCLKVIDSPDLINEFSNWLVGEGEMSEWPLLHTLINNCLTEHHDITLETLRFFETIIEKGTEHSIHRLVLSRVCSRGYYSPQTIQDDDERDRLNDVSLWRERERNKEALQQLQHEDRVAEQIAALAGLRDQPWASADLHMLVNSFLLLLPRAILSDPVGSDYEHYIHDAHRHYQYWLDTTATFNWPTDQNWTDNTASSTHSYDSRPEADIHLDEAFESAKADSPNTSPDTHYSIDSQFSQKLVIKKDKHYSINSNSEDEFDEGPFMKMLFKLLSNMPSQPYQVNLLLTAIISKLALMPHSNLHEYLLNPMLPTAKKTQTLFKTMQDLARRLTMEIPRIRNYKKVIENTRLQLMSEDPSYDERGEHNQLVESLIVLEEFCKELAAIAFVKHQHNVVMNR
ncbi:FHF complex subunit HOOK interacting protein 2A-like [Plodia interpunctella]|uniref:FHF complex subunit HOOK interacting protein 2A-like n=1 Tax=Plodia interpunctella TaxID=58824 RepID=UPI0023686E30|nr:FHF complex subunit HOOK interacting protein 2A-like [Plodia interpunctella]XP_053616005.1 FHF complex subunit HOOK interacting protein 2A-like [Plodia interpunctella]